MNRFFNLLLVSAFFIALSCHKEHLPDCAIADPKNGQIFSIEEDIMIKVIADDSNGIITSVHLYIDNQCYSGTVDFPYHFTVKAGKLSTGLHTVKAIAQNNSGKKSEASITLSVIEPETEESPDFVSFSDGKLPKGWVANGWFVDPNFGKDDFYSLYSKIDSATVSATKTCNSIEFFLHFTYPAFPGVVFYVDDKLWEEIPAYGNNNTTKNYSLSDSLHTFTWKFLKSFNQSLPPYHGNSANLDNILFETR